VAVIGNGDDLHGGVADNELSGIDDDLVGESGTDQCTAGGSRDTFSSG
jgi:hypothetical protein